jgi:SSS family solute:Na+ symporter
MTQPPAFSLEFWDYFAFAAYFVGLSLVSFWAGRRERGSAEDYFLAGKRLPWYVVGGSFIGGNISSEHFIGMIGAAAVYGICVAMSEWMNVATFSLLIWFFIPFLLASQVFTTPEFLERRFSPALRQIFAAVTVVSNVVAFLAAVLYGGGIALVQLFGWDLWFSILLLGIVAGGWAIYGGLSSVAWGDLFMVAVMVAGGITVTLLGLNALRGEGQSLLDGFRVMLERNQAAAGPWAEAVARNVHHLAGTDSYNRLSVFQPASHPTHPWTSLLLGIFSVSIWYNVLNQFMIQRVLGARNSYHARMGIVFAGFMKVFLPTIIVLPGLILFALRPEILAQPWEQVRPAADQGYVHLLQSLVPVGLRGLFLAGLFGAIQSTVNSVLNSTATVITLDFYRPLVRPSASQRQLVGVGIVSSIVVLAVAIVLGGFVGWLRGGLFIYIQELYAFFAPPFAAVFLLGILWKRINSAGALAAVALGFLVGIGLKVYVQLMPLHPAWIEPYANQSCITWLVCVAVCVAVSLATAPPRPEQVTDQVTMNWRKLNILGNLGTRWYTSVVLWWLVFVAATAGLLVFFSGLVFPGGS